MLRRRRITATTRMMTGGTIDEFALLSLQAQRFHLALVMLSSFWVPTCPSAVWVLAKTFHDSNGWKGRYPSLVAVAHQSSC